MENRIVPTQILNFKAKQISAGVNYSIFIDFNDNVWSFGLNDDGQLGLGDNLNRIIPTQIINIKAKQVSAGWHSSSLIDMNYGLWLFGSHIRKKVISSTPILVNNLKVYQVSEGSTHIMMIATKIENLDIVSE